MSDMPTIEDMVKGQICYGENSELIQRFEDAKEECGCDGEDDMMMEGDMDMGMEDSMEDDETTSGEMTEMDEEKMQHKESKFSK